MNKTLLLRGSALALAVLCWWQPASAQDNLALAPTNKLTDGGFEVDAPSYWTPSGAGATWSTERAHSAERSLKLSGVGEASWTQGEVIRNWVNSFPANTALTLGAWVYTEGVNTSPTTDAQKFQIVYTFRDANGAVLLGQSLVLDLPQSAASTNGWVEITTASLGEITLPAPATSVTVVVRKGANATGSVYVDDFFARGAGWHGANVDLPGGWYLYWDGFDGGVAAQPFVVSATTTQAHSGARSLRIERVNPAATSEAVAITERVPVTVGRPVVVSFWLKNENSPAATAPINNNNNVGITALWYRSMQSGAAGYNEIGGADIKLNGEYNSQVIPLVPRPSSNGWTQYSFVLNPLAESVGMELRLRYWNDFTGVTYWDDVFIGDVADVAAQVPNLLPNDATGFEGTTPSYWTPSGAGATWSTTRWHSAERSLQLAGAGEASWTQGEVIRNWVDRFPANTALTLGAWVYTEGVNTAPTTDDQKFQIVYTFRDANGASLLGAPVVLDVPQSAASTSGWTRITTASLGEITLPADARSVTAVVRKGANAIGTVNVDDFFVQGAGWHGANVDLPGGWYLYWDGFDGGVAAQPFVVSQTTTQAHSGSNSLRVERVNPAATSEAVAISPRVPAAPGQPMLVSFWLKNENSPAATAPSDNNNNVGLVALWYRSMQSGAAGYNEITGADIKLNGQYNSQVIPLLPRPASNGWTNYAFVLYPVAETAGMEVRLRYWHDFTGVTYWDDVSITNVGGGALNPVASEGAPRPNVPGAIPPGTSWLLPTAPNPTRGTTQVRFRLPDAAEVAVEVYDLLGRRVAVLADNQRFPGGDHALTLETAGLPAGRYLVVLRTPTRADAQTLTVVR